MSLTTLVLMVGSCLGKNRRRFDKMDKLDNLDKLDKQVNLESVSQHFCALLIRIVGAKLKLGHERRQTDCIQLRPLKSDKKAKQLLITKNTKNNCKSSPLAHSEILPDFWTPSCY